MQIKGGTSKDQRVVQNSQKKNSFNSDTNDPRIVNPGHYEKIAIDKCGWGAEGTETSIYFVNVKLRWEFRYYIA